MQPSEPILESNCIVSNLQLLIGTSISYGSVVFVISEE